MNGSNNANRVGAIPIKDIPAKTMTGMIDKYGNKIIGGVVKNENSTSTNDASASDANQGDKPNDTRV